MSLDEKAKQSTLKNELERTQDELLKIKTELNQTGPSLTRKELVTYLRKTATRIHADVIQEEETIKSINRGSRA